MNLTEGTKLNGFKVTRIREEKELNGRLVEMTHEKTGAELCWIDNKELNKTFSIAFKTLPEDSTGVFHILEHSVLCGSDKYPVKEPFVDLLKSSMNTFLNAMTFPDKTVYPISSRNNRDFLNLTSVYLDAVFAPALRTNPNVFRQEGIHTEFNENGAPLYKGVVFNEMKGAMSDLDSIIFRGINAVLFPDNCYGFNSGGDPRVIPDLTYEQYKATYNSYYHPTNSRIFLDGDVPLEETLTLIDSYLQKYEKSPTVHEINNQKPIVTNSTDRYEIAEGEDNGKKNVLVLAKITASWEENEKILASEVLCDVIAGTNEAPIKRAVLSSGLAEDFSIDFEYGIAQPYLLIVARNIENGNDGKIRKIINDAAKKLIKEGIDKKSLTASINSMAYRLKELPEPRGIERAINIQNSWLYGGDPMTYLVYDKVIEKLRKMAEGDGFEKLLSELLENDEELSSLYITPSSKLGEELRAEEEKRLQSETASLTEKQMNELKAQKESLDKWQTEPDSPEAKAMLPKLPLSEVNELPEITDTTVKNVNGAKILYHEVATNGIVHLTMYFPLTNLTSDELTKIALLPRLYKELPTKNYSVLELQQRIKTYIGSLYFNLIALNRGKKESCTPCLTVNAGILRENLAEAKKLLEEIILNTEFDHNDKIKEKAAQVDDALRQSAMGSGHALAWSCACSHFTATDAANEAISGYSAINHIHNFVKSFDSAIDEFKSLIKRVYQESIIRNGLVISVTNTEEIDISDLISAMPEGGELPETAEYTSKLPYNMGIKVPSQVSYAVKGYHLSETGEKLSGSLMVLNTILTYDYLWNKIRVQGGAYGAGMKTQSFGGRMFCYSYRDPSPSRSLEIYNTLSDYVKELCGGDEGIENYIIAEIGNSEPLLSPTDKGVRADSLWFMGIDENEQIRIRKEILSTNKEKLLDKCRMLSEFADKGAVCVVGHETALKDCKGLEILEF